jgi:large subunit ribosomal protein L23
MSIKSYILYRPLMTEKMSRLEENENKFGFEVHPDANKLEIKTAVEEKFGVHVVKVATQNRLGKAKGMTTKSNGKSLRTMGKRANWKRAVVTLRDGDKIDLFDAEGAG